VAEGTKEEGMRGEEAREGEREKEVGEGGSRGEVME
jgi:hypothetical protein